MVGTLKLLHIFITISFDNFGQTDFQNAYYLILMINPTLQNKKNFPLWLAHEGKNKKKGYIF